ncbi:50S ribosomal protein L14e [Methanotorris igneus]|uniref:Large ribosomal subunit protein eL14 n=1 Tax=Methanotorris igneus (strain DSM 5666 / JCM 11834 / Kol 5) TaxID=880724 RepID=F6BBN7_METIK|nr:50S ribosomal protein L14e [Methanotorris igneus]AEF96046.1 50S ribosomal protein L14e [Methanotorris igneus Kol 5]
MPAIEIGRVCIKTMGREAGKTCVIVDIIDRNFVLIDGEVKRRRCNIKHIEPTDKKVDIEKGASTEEVRLALDAAGLLKN